MRVTNLEQSKKLIEAGLPINTAEYYLNLKDNIVHSLDGKYFYEIVPNLTDYVPAWSYNKLMDIALNCVPNKKPFFKLGVCINLIKIITNALESGEFEFENL